MENQLSTEKSEPIFKMDSELRVTLKDLQNSINRLIEIKQVSESAKILWAKEVQPGSCFDDELNIMPGSILMGLEWMEDGKVTNGTLRIEPPMIGSKYLN